MKKIFTRLFAVLLLSLVCTSAWAQFENGKVYRIVCSGTTTVSLGASALTDVAAVSTSETEKTQQWYVTVSGSNYTFRNLANGRYLQGNNATSNAWGLTKESNNFTVTAVNGNYAIRGASHNNGYGYMHKDAGNNIVSWESGAANSQWTPIEVSYTAEELQAVWDEVESLVVPSTTVDTYEGYLDVLFSDKSCVTPKLATLDAAKATEAYNNLPVTLQKMVDKVYGGDWTESTVAPADRPNGNNNTNHSLWTVADTWNNDYAKKFRVQMYEPYSVEGEITSYLRINAHCNMDNPTGIYANAGEPMYIMVEGTIAEGAELWVAHQVGHGATNYYNNAAYTQLHEGLNVVPYFADGSQLWINYLVHTYNDSEKTIAEKFPHKLSEYKPLKIHIEGGKINGFFNAMGDYRSTEVSGDANGGENLWGEVDNDADWNYYKARAALSGDFALLGHRQTLLFDFGTYSSTKGHFGVANAEGGIEYALAYHLENITVPATPNCYAGSGKAFGNYSDTYYPGMQLSATTGKINIMLEAWDRIQYSEHASLGLLSVANINKMNALYPRWTTAGEAAEIYNYGEATINNVTQTYQQFCQGIDYSEYYNHHGAAVGAGSGYMSGGWRVCNYHYNTMGSIIGKIADEAGPTWGPAHEIGHQHQNIFNLNGQTEVTNNFHANVAVWYMGMGTSRYNGSEGSLSSVLGAYNTDGNDLYTNNIWALTHLYYRLWLYYHLAGNNTQFWPRLFELLRQVPIVNGGQISGETSLLRFYQHACDAAGEDLTEFFRAHGFFEIMTDRLVGDYSNGTYNVTEEQIETAISAVKAKDYPKNYAILLINDGTSETTLKHDGATNRSLWDSNPSAEYGSVTDFIEGNTDVTDAYDAIVSADGTVTMSGGEGGVGFLILNEEGEIVSFSNKASFEISDEAAYLLATGKAEIVAVDAENETTEAEVDLSAVQSSLIVTLVADVENLLKYVDDTYTKVGYYKASSVVDLQSALNTAKETIETGTGLAAAYELLYAEYQKVLNDENARVAIVSGAKYAIKSKPGNDYMDVDGSGNVKTTNSSTFPTDDSDLWIIEIASKDTYNIKNANTGKYLQEVSDANSVNFTVGDNAVNYGITNVDYVYHAFSTKKYPGRYMDRHSATQVATWGGIGENAKWLITLADNNLAEEASAIAELQALIAKAESLVTEVATVSLKGELQLQTDNANSAFFITSNATETGHEPKYLLDNNVSTFFHTVWWGTSPGADHYLQIDLGEEYPIDQFVFEYTNLPTTSNNVDAAEAITVQVANALDNFTTIANLTTSDSNPLPTAKGGTYTSATMGTKGDTYRYIRLIVTDATGGMLSNHYYFGMSEFSLERLNSYSKVKDAYTGHITQDVVATVADKLADAKTAITNGGDIAAAKSNLQTAYDALLLEYNDVVDAKKTELQDLIDATNELIDQVGEATVIAGGPVNLHGKLYAERPYTSGTESHADYSSVENDYNLLDGDKGTYFHSDYNVSTMVSPPYIRVDMGEGNSITKFTFNYTTRGATGCAPKTIEVYGGNAVAGVAKGAIQSSAALNAVTTPTKIVIKNLSGTNGLYFAGESNVSEINQAVLVWEPVTEGTPGTYYLRTTDADNGYIQASTGANVTITLGTKANAQVFHTSAPVSGGSGENAFATETLATGSDTGNLVRFVQDGKSTWLNVNTAGSAPRLGNSGTGGWTVHNVYTVVETTVPEFETTPLATFNSDDTTNPLPLTASTDWVSLTEIGNGNSYRYLKFSVTNSEGVKNGNKYYFVMSEFGLTVSPVREVSVDAAYSAVISEDLLVDTRRTVNDSETLCGYATSYSATVDQLVAQKAILQEAYDRLLAAKENTAELKQDLQSVYDDALELYNKMATDGNPKVNVDYAPSALTNAQLEAAKSALDATKSVLDDDAALPDEIGSAKETLQTAYNALLVVENANEKGTLATTDLETLINNTKTLLGTIAENSTSNAEIALQVGYADSEYYLWSNAPANDCNDYSIKVQGLIDENNDGSANTGTFFGTDWNNPADAYTHYIEVDMGVNTVLEDLSIDYTTRDSNHADSRPNGLKFFGSNNKVDYEEFYTVTTGLPADANTKWTMPAPIELTKNYRYVRIAVSSPRGSCFNMADFNLYTNIDYSLKDYYGTATGIDFEELCLALQSAENIVSRAYLTTAQYNAVYENLNSCYTAANNVVIADYTERDDLDTLIKETEPIVTEVATIDETETEIEMQCTNPSAPYYLYCNAEGKENGTGDKTGVAALVGDNKDNTTHLHTAYQGSTDDDLDHYLRLDMGENEALASFKFSYTGRNDNNNNAPVRMVIEGSNDLASFEEIAVLDNLPTTESTVTYTTPEALTNGKAYRYIRFMVTKTKNGATYNGHPFFVLSKFTVTACKTIEVAESYVSPNLPLSTLVKANNEVEDAKQVMNTYTIEDDYNTAKNELQDAKDALNLAMNLKELPVTLTTDVNNPVLYKIKINRGSTKLLQYDNGTTMVAVADEYIGNKYQAWYFMQGTDETGYDDILIYPYWSSDAANTTLRLGTNDISDGNSKVKAVDGSDATYKQNWYITFTEGTTAEGWFNIQPEGKANYFSNHGGESEKMGFLNNASDDGSEFQFVLDETDYSLSDAYYALYNKYTELGGKLTGGTAIGDYTEASVTEYNDAYNTAGTLLEAKASTDDEYTAARETLENEYATIEYVMPEEGKFYLIRSISTEAYCNGKYVHALCDKRPTNANQNHKHLVFDALGDIAQYPLAVFVFEDINANGECKMKNLHTGMYVKSFTKNAEHMTTDYESAATVKIGNFAPGQAILRIGNTAPMHAQNANSVIVHWEAAAGNASLWSIDEVTDLSQIVHNVTMNATFSSVTLGYNATAPAGVRVYNAKGIDSGYVTLEKIADGDEANNVIPANTPVILYRADDVKTKTFSYTEATAAQPSESLLGGSLYTKYVECDDSDYYKLMIKSGEAKMYLMYKEFDANGNSLGETHAGGHIKCTANKIFMRVPGLSQAAVYSMRFINPETTDIDGVNAENGEEKTIYDLQGRKLTEITAPGIYIVNGKKVLVK